MGPNYSILREALLTSLGKSFHFLFISGVYLIDSVSPTGQRAPGEDVFFVDPGRGSGTQEALNNQLSKVT